MSPSERPGTDTKSNISRIIASRGTFSLDGVEIGVDDSVDMGSLADRLKRTSKDLAIFKDSVSDMLGNSKVSKVGSVISGFSMNPVK